MGFFDELADGFRRLTGGVDQKLLVTGILARAELVSLSLSGSTITIMNGPVERTCTFGLKVMMNDRAPYEATVTQRVQEIAIPQLQAPGVVLAVRVDPTNPANVAIDFFSEPPVVNLPESTGPGSAKDILATGTPVTVVLVANQPIGVNNHEGHPVHALTLTVATGVPEPYQVQVGNAIPPFALPLVYPGSKLHAKLGSDPNAIVVDWAAGPAS
jgi:hypothetical protein